MAFNSIQYAVLLAAVFGLYRLLARRGQNVVLLVASYLFYAAWNPYFLSLLWISTGSDFLIGRALGKTVDRARRLWLLRASIGVNIGILGFFKYFGFFVDSATDLLGAIGLNADVATLNIILPVGISFYTFQTMSYTIDIYRQELEPTDDLLSFAVFVAFFPQLVAGPIERAKRLLPQFTNDRERISGEQFGSGMLLIFVGLFKKVVIADALAPFVQETFAASGTAGWLTLLVAVYAFSLQIYGDFSGYSSIARGSARLLGIDLMVNFNQPYLSRNITQFWRTWHISLSSWLRDYVYIPLGGNRGGVRTIVRNLMLTMLIGGLWHGAAWTFVVWGGLHGTYLVLHRRFRDSSQVSATYVPTWKDLPAILATFHLVAFSWIFFRADSFSQAWEVMTGILGLRQADGFPYGGLGLVLPAFAMVILIDLIQRKGKRHEAFLGLPSFAQGALYGTYFVAILLFSGQETVDFIYFQF